MSKIEQSNLVEELLSLPDNIASHIAAFLISTFVPEIPAVQKQLDEALSGHSLNIGMKARRINAQVLRGVMKKDRKNYLEYAKTVNDANYTIVRPHVNTEGKSTVVRHEVVNGIIVRTVIDIPEEKVQIVRSMLEQSAPGEPIMSVSEYKVNNGVTTEGDRWLLANSEHGQKVFVRISNKYEEPDGSSSTPKVRAEFRRARVLTEEQLMKHGELRNAFFGSSQEIFDETYARYREKITFLEESHLAVALPA
jgi:stress-induced morphogen